MRKISIQYKEYLKGKEWKILRRKAYLRANHKCEFCNKPAAHVHHIKYPKNLKDDKLENLVVVCEKCHSLNHGIRKKLNIYLAGKLEGQGGIKWKAIKKIEHFANFYSSDRDNSRSGNWDDHCISFDEDNMRESVREDVCNQVYRTDLLVAILDKELSCGSIAEIAWFAAHRIPCFVYILIKTKGEKGYPTGENEVIYKEYENKKGKTQWGKLHDAYWLVSHFPNVATRTVENKKELVESLLELISKISNEKRGEVSKNE